MKDFGVAVTFKADWLDTFGLMEKIQENLRESMRDAMDLEFGLTMLRLQHPQRARRWAKATREYQDWLATLEPPQWPVCETCGQPLPADDDY